MRNSRSLSAKPSSQETIGGFVYLLFQFFCLPSVLSFVNGHLQRPLSESELNFLFYLINFIAILLIFHDFLSRNLNQLTQHPIIFLESIILGFVFYYGCNWLTTKLVGLLVPGFTNYNDQSVVALLRGNYFLTFAGTVILVPLTEETLFRGLIFRNLYGKSRWAAYIVSILAFAVIHIIGYIGQYSALELLMAFLQYLPAGLCLAWAYTRADTIFAPIVIHAAINFVSINALR